MEHFMEHMVSISTADNDNAGWADVLDGVGTILYIFNICIPYCSTAETTHPLKSTR